MASGYVISGSGFAMAKMIGFFSIERTMSWVTMPLTDTPQKASASFMASARVLQSVFRRYFSLYGFIFSRPWCSTPLLSTIRMLSGSTPRATYMFAQAIPAAPAPENTTRTFLMSFPTISRAFTSAAPLMIAVPCWSSWNTGIFISRFSVSSM